MKGKKPTILVVEDEQDIRNMTYMLLLGTGYNPLLAADGQEALKFLGNGNDISLAMIDTQMPEMDGLKVTRTIRKDSRFGRYKSLPIILMGAAYSFNGREEEKEAIGAGANCYMKKPFENKELLSKIKELIGEYSQKTTKGR